MSDILDLHTLSDPTDRHSLDELRAHLADEELSDTYTWSVTHESNDGMGNVQLVAALGRPAYITADSADVAVTLDGNTATIYLTEDALHSLADALAYWRTWANERSGGDGR